MVIKYAIVLMVRNIHHFAHYFHSHGMGLKPCLRDPSSVSLASHDLVCNMVFEIVHAFEWFLGYGEGENHGS